MTLAELMTCIPETVAASRHHLCMALKVFCQIRFSMHLGLGVYGGKFMIRRSYGHHHPEAVRREVDMYKSK
jgi:hypothetical protein